MFFLARLLRIRNFFIFDADPDPACYPAADADPGSKNDTDPCVSGSTTLPDPVNKFCQQVKLNKTIWTEKNMPNSSSTIPIVRGAPEEKKRV